MNWAKLLMEMLSYAPIVVHGVEATMQGASGQSKRDKAVGLLTLGAQIAQQCAPNQAPAVQAVTNAAGAIIDATVAVANATGDLSHAKPQPAQPAQ